MSEHLSPPIVPKEGGVAQRITAFADFIQAVYEGKGMQSQMPADILQQELERGYGAPGEYSYSMTRTLFKRIRKEERPLLLQAIGTLIEDLQVPQYTKAALLRHYTLSDFTSVVHPYVLKLLETPSKSDVLEKSLESYLKHKQMIDTMNYFKTEEVPPRKQRILREKDYIQEEQMFGHKILRKIVKGWVIEHDPDFEDKYSFYTFGKPLDLKYRYLGLDISVSEDHTDRFLIADWYDNHTLEDFLPVGNLFTQLILSEETQPTNCSGIQDEDTPPGIYLYPDDDSSTIYGERIYIPFPGQELTRKMLEIALRANQNFINYTLDECSIKIWTPKGDQLHFHPSVPDDPDRHRVNTAFPLESRYFLELRGLIPANAIVPIITTNNRKGLPVQEIESILS